MFCSNCGVANTDEAQTCASCGNILKSQALQADKAKEQVKVAVNDAWEAFRTLWSDPVGGLLRTYQGLGSGRAVGVGVAFGLIFALCIAIAISRIPFFGLVSDLTGFGGFSKLLLIGCVPFISLTVACLMGGKAGGSKGSVSSDAFIAGAALLPLGIASVIASLIGAANVEILVTLFIVAACLNILILFAGLTRISMVSEKFASFSVPLMLIASFWISKVIYVALFTR